MASPLLTCSGSRCASRAGIGPSWGAALSLAPLRFSTRRPWAGEPCRLFRTPLEWLQNGIEGCAVILDATRAKQILDWAPGNFGAMDLDHANELVAIGIDPKRIVVPVRRAA